MPQVVPKTVGQSLYWSYANVAMVFSARKHGEASYQKLDFIVRSKMYYGLLRGGLKLGSFVEDEKEKLAFPGHCTYCGESANLSLDHVIPQLEGGVDGADNLVVACRSCNSSKGAVDFLVWMSKRGEFPPLVLLRRYLKLTIRYCTRLGLMETPLGEALDSDPPLSFALGMIPHQFPAPRELLTRVQPVCGGQAEAEAAAAADTAR